MKIQYKVNRAMVPNTLIKKWFTFPSLWYAILIGGKNQVHNRKRVLSEVSQLRNHLGFTELLTKSRLVLVRDIFKGIKIKVACNKCIIYITIKGKTDQIYDRRQSLGRRIRWSIKCTKEEFSMMNYDFNPNALNIRQLEIISAT